MGNMFNYTNHNQKRLFFIKAGLFGLVIIPIYNFVKYYRNIMTYFALKNDGLVQEHKANYRPNRIILIRHGESEANVNAKIYSHIPDNKISLTEKGLQMASDTGKYLKSIIGEEKFKIYYSPFNRTRQTCDGIIQHFNKENYKRVEEPRLREQEWGNNQDYNQLQKILEEREHIGKFYYRFPTGESGADVYDRASSFLSSLFRLIDKESNTDSNSKYQHQYSNIILVSHGLFIRLFLMRYFKYTVEEFEKMSNPGNCEVIILNKTLHGKYILEKPLNKK